MSCLDVNTCALVLPPACSYTPRYMTRLLSAGVVVAVGLGAAVAAQAPKPPAKAPLRTPARTAATAAPGPRDWPNTGNDPGSMKFSPLTQITPENVTGLTTA